LLGLIQPPVCDDAVHSVGELRAAFRLIRRQFRQVQATSRLNLPYAQRERVRYRGSPVAAHGAGTLVLVITVLKNKQPGGD
jgi:hypothetical protein